MIELRGATLSAGTFRLQDLDLVVPSGAYAVLMGRTGCGKTTLLETLCGLHPLEAGTLRLGDREVTRLGPAERQVGYVPQDGALFPTLTVRDHLAFGPRFRGWGRAEITARVEELAAALGIASLLERRPRGLSGGERQRVALGRALAARPPVLLLDEPLSAVDEETRDGLCTLLAGLPAAAAVTVLHVTHSQAEAERLATLRMRLADGRLHAE